MQQKRNDQKPNGEIVTLSPISATVPDDPRPEQAGRHFREYMAGSEHPLAPLGKFAQRSRNERRLPRSATTSVVLQHLQVETKGRKPLTLLTHVTILRFESWQGGALPTSLGLSMSASSREVVRVRTLYRAETYNMPFQSHSLLNYAAGRAVQRSGLNAEHHASGANVISVNRRRR